MPIRDLALEYFPPGQLGPVRQRSLPSSPLALMAVKLAADAHAVAAAALITHAAIKPVILLATDILMVRAL
jgi:hypothetical protein